MDLVGKLFFSCLKNNFKFEFPLWCYTKKNQGCKEGVSKTLHLLDLHEMTTNFLRQLRLWSSITYILPSTSSLKSWGEEPLLGMWLDESHHPWNVAAVQGNPRSSEQETLKKTVYSQDAVCRNGHSCFLMWSTCVPNLRVHFHTEKDQTQLCAC